MSVEISIQICHLNNKFSDVDGLVVCALACSAESSMFNLQYTQTTYWWTVMSIIPAVCHSLLNNVIRACSDQSTTAADENFNNEIY